ncbi:MAG: YHS domain-containing (seleno)protein [Bdellovibrionales bacterium]
MKKFLFITLAALTVLFGAPAQADIYTGTFSNTAVNGYDTVAYFTQSRPVKGNKEFSTEWKGAKWNFSSAENLELFKTNPEKYAPQYGGYCAFAVGHNSLAAGNPNHWHIEDGKLYLNINETIQNKWLPRRDELISKADKNFPALSK